MPMTKHLKKPILASIIAAALILSGCASDEAVNSQNGTHSPNRAAVNNARSNVQWTGIYQGIFPCSGCEGVATMLKLNPDMTYALRTRQLGRENIDRKSNGTFRWLPDNSHIVLQGKNQNRIFRVGNGFLQLTDSNGKPVKTNNPNAFYLEKTD